MKGSKYCEVTKAARGQKIVTCHGRDDSNHDLPGAKKLGGSTTNLAHSLPGTAAKQGGNA